MIELALPLLYTFAGVLMFLEHRFPAHPLMIEWKWYVRAALVNALIFGVYICGPGAIFAVIGCPLTQWYF